MPHHAAGEEHPVRVAFALASIAPLARRRRTRRAREGDETSEKKKNRSPLTFFRPRRSTRFAVRAEHRERGADGSRREHHAGVRAERGAHDRRGARGAARGEKARATRERELVYGTAGTTFRVTGNRRAHVFLTVDGFFHHPERLLDEHTRLRVRRRSLQERFRSAR